MVTSDKVEEGSATEDDYPVHRCVFDGDVRKLSALIRSGHQLNSIPLTFHNQGAVCEKVSFQQTHNKVCVSYC